MAAREGPLFPDEARFMGYAARVMRGLIIDHARANIALSNVAVNSRLRHSNSTRAKIEPTIGNWIR
jgi:DNA-directed RNA polymerase specialized sigma subunit